MQDPSTTPTLLDSSYLRGNPSTVRARKRPVQVSVRFSAEATMVATREGPVAAAAGDAILTDAHGNCWPVAAAVFASKYRPTAAFPSGTDGPYEALPIEVDAAMVPFAFAARHREGGSLLHGIAGDWLVDYGNGSLGVVGQAIFRESYEVIAQ